MRYFVLLFVSITLLSGGIVESALAGLLIFLGGSFTGFCFGGFSAAIEAIALTAIALAADNGRLVAFKAMETTSRVRHGHQKPMRAGFNAHTVQHLMGRANARFFGHDVNWTVKS
jgi:hypothetical protein